MAISRFILVMKSRSKRKSKKEITPPTTKRSKVYHRSHNSEEGLVLVVGSGDVGQLGLGPDIMEKSRPALVELPEAVIQVCAGGMHTICLTVSGKVYSFGCNDEGALGRDTTEEGSETTPQLVELPGKVVQVSAGDSHSAALFEDGKVFVWGNFRDGNGSLGLTTEGAVKEPMEYVPSEIFVKIASGGDHLVLLTLDGRIYTAGCGEQGQLGRIAKQFSSRGGRKGLELILSPQVVRFRASTKVQPKFSDIWAIQYATFAEEKQTGHIYSWGLNNYDQLGFSDLEDRFVPQKVLSFSDQTWLDIGGGMHHTVALSSDGKVYVLGRGDYGRLGLGEAVTLANQPTRVEALKDKVIKISAAGSVSYGITSDGKLYAWGMGTNNQLASGNDDDAWTPKQMGGKQLAERKGIAISGGGQHCVMLCKSS
ncbi:regulator of chromosome condensation isoform X1 [Octopus sinensis]|uniref:Regulator of chromosome condensation isoform X1 n=2 Tax=Octopus sinensis TaxID=2607531 RepID=A0A7E6F429_9MOLL|nr:regulator of chromosome condensation isoform X1 [Octopus sinensis]